MAEKFQETGAILKNERIADGMFWLQVKAPEIARHARPGQFVHVRVTGPSVQFLRMPFAVYDATRRRRHLLPGARRGHPAALRSFLR